MQITDDNLIEYLLGDASAQLSEEIERQLVLDAALVERLNHFRFVLGQVDSVSGIYEPPCDLLESTLARIDAGQSGSENAGEAEGNVALAAGLSPARSVAKSSRTFWDSAVLTVSLALLCCLALPAIVRARFESRRAQCASNLRSTGYSLFNYALSDPQRRFPFVGRDPRFGFAGVYAVRLQSAGYDLRPSQLQCASLIAIDGDTPRLFLQSIPTLTQLADIAWPELVDLQRAIGGDYAYNLGVVEDSRVVAARYEGRGSYAILSDAPLFDGGVEQSNAEQLIAHDGKGSNILYEDGHIQFVSADFLGPVSDGSADHPFRNLRGQHAPGLNPEDASLAPSHFVPLAK